MSEQELSQTADDQVKTAEEAGEENTVAAIGEPDADSIDETVVVEGESTIVESAPEADVDAVTADSQMVGDAADLDSEQADGTDETDVLEPFPVGGIAIEGRVKNELFLCKGAEGIRDLTPQNGVFGIGLVLVDGEAPVLELAIVDTAHKNGGCAARVDMEGGIHVQIGIGLAEAILELSWIENDRMNFLMRKEFHT